MGKVVDKPATSLITNLRYERKFVFKNTAVSEVIQRVYQNSFGFKEVFHRRKINNIYFDDTNYNFYKQNVEGVAQRKKLRLRWYGDDTHKIEYPVIEVKKKIGEVGDKDSFRLPDLQIDLKKESAAAVQRLIIKNTDKYINLHQTLKILHPTLLNTYERRYFLSFCGLYRVTVDFNQAFFNPNYTVFEQSRSSLSDIVLELKYAIDDDHQARELSQQIGCRLSKNSKYVNGMNLLYHIALL